jgi:hypothetical protein
MKARFRFGPHALVLTGAVTLVIACGGLRDQPIVIEDDPNGSSGSGNTGGTPGATAGNTSTSGMAGEPDDGIGGLPSGGAPSLEGAPTVVEVTPVDGAGDIVPTSAVRIDFSEGLDESTVTSDTIQLLDGATPVPGSLTYQGGAVLFEPANNLSLLTTYEVAVSTGVTDTDGVALEAPFSSTFSIRDGAWNEETSFAADYTTVWTARTAMDAHGNALVAWVGNDSNIYARWYDAAQQSWGAITPIESQSGAADSPQVAVSPNGDAVVAFQVDGGNKQIWARRFVNGAWEPNETLVSSLPPSTTLRGQIQLSFKGANLLAVWTRATVITGTTVGLIDAASAAPTGAWTVVDQIEYAAEPLKTVGSELSLATDASGNALVVYGFANGNTTLYPTFLRYTAATGLWKPPAPLRQNDLAAVGGDSSYYGPTITMNDSGDAVASWVTRTEGIFDILASRFTNAGGWEAPVSLEQADGNAFQTWGNIAAHGDSFTVTWKQMVGSEFNAYRATYAGEDGTWGDAALLSSGATNNWFGAPVIFGDLHGNLLAAWEEGYEDAPGLVFTRYSALTGMWSAPDTLTTLTDTGYSEVWLGGSADGTIGAALGTYFDGGWTGFRFAAFR